MSKESYARGFCKAAEAAGVDPVALAKFAKDTTHGPKYKTDGFAPVWGPEERKINYDIEKLIPYYSPEYFPKRRLGSGPSDSLYRLLESESKKGDILSKNPQERLRQELMPKHKAWFDAHTNAASKALSPLKRVNYPANEPIPLYLVSLIDKIYHDEMKRTTSAPPDRASAPVSSAARPVEVKPGLN